MCDSFTVNCHTTFNQRSTLRGCNRVLLRQMRRQAEVKTTRLRFKPLSLASCYLRFSRRFSNYIPLKIRSLPMNHVSLLEADIRV